MCECYLDLTRRNLLAVITGSLSAFGGCQFRTITDNNSDIDSTVSEAALLPTVEGPDPIGCINGCVYGAYESTLYQLNGIRVEHGNRTATPRDANALEWTPVTTVDPAPYVQFIEKTSEEEIIVGNRNALYRSDGWTSFNDGTDSNEITFEPVIKSDGSSWFLPRTVSARNGAVLTTTYQAGERPWDGHKVWLSTDDGRPGTFEPVCDLGDRLETHPNYDPAGNNERERPHNPTQAHFHFAEIDPYADTDSETGRLWTGWHIPGDLEECCFSDDGGATWKRLITEDNQHGHAPTTADATPGGIIWGSDYQYPAGIYITPRNRVADGVFRLLEEWVTPVPEEWMPGFAQDSYFDADRNLVFVAFRSQAPGVRGTIAVGKVDDFKYIWEQETPNKDLGTGAFGAWPHHERTLIGWVRGDSDNEYVLHGEVDNWPAGTTSG